MIVPLFKSFEDAQREQHEICAQHYAEWQAAGDLWKATIAAIDDDDAELAKYDAPQVTLAKAEASRLLAENSLRTSAKMEATLDLHRTWQEITQKRNDKLWGLNAVAKRSARFASAQRPTYRTNATILKHPAASKPQ